MSSNDFEVGKEFGATAEQMRFVLGGTALVYRSGDTDTDAATLKELARCFPDAAFTAPKPSVEFSEERLATLDDLPPPKAKK